MALMHQNDRNTYGIYDQYYFGDSIMMAPLLNKGGARQVYIPDGKWYDYHTGNELQKTGWIDVETDLDTMPMYVPAGAVVVYGTEKKHTNESVKEFLNISIYSGADSVFNYKNGSDEFEFVVKYKNGICSFDDGGCTVPYELTIVGE